MKSFLMRKSHDDGHAFEGSGLSRAVSIAVLFVTPIKIKSHLKENKENKCHPKMDGMDVFCVIAGVWMIQPWQGCKSVESC